MHKLKCTAVREVEYLTGKIETLEKAIQIPESTSNLSPEPGKNGSPRTTPALSATTLQPSSSSEDDDEDDDLRARQEPGGWPEDEDDYRPPVTTGSTTQQSFPFWLFPMLVFGVVLVAVIAFHYTGGSRGAVQ